MELPVARLRERSWLMHAIELPLFDRMMLASGRTAEEMDRELRLLLAVKLFELGRVSSGQATEVAGMSRLAMIDELGRMKVAVIVSARRTYEAPHGSMSGTPTRS
jgi:predicted HTH domain antitoxin